MIALIATLLLPGRRLDNPGATAEAVAQELSASLRRTRLAAIQAGQPTSFELDLDNRRFRGHAEAWQGLPADLSLGFEGAAEFMRGSEQGAIRFFADGSASGGSITLGSGPGRRVLTTNWLLGTTRTARGQPRKRTSNRSCANSPKGPAGRAGNGGHAGHSVRRSQHRRARSIQDRKPAREDAGFMLLELLIAMAILAMALGALTMGSATALRAQARAEAITEAVHRAESALALIGHSSPLEVGERVTRLSKGWRQRVIIRPLALRLPERANLRFAPLAYDIELTIEDERGRELIRLATVKLGQP